MTVIESGFVDKGKNGGPECFFGKNFIEKIHFFFCEPDARGEQVGESLFVGIDISQTLAFFLYFLPRDPCARSAAGKESHQ